MYNIFLRYFDTVKLVETSEELFNLFNKANYLAAIEWDKDNQFEEICDKIDNEVFEIARSIFNINPDHHLEIDDFKPIGDDDFFSYANILITNTDDKGTKYWGKDLKVGKFKPWNLLCDNLPMVES